jgi:hypothetical protein
MVRNQADKGKGEEPLLVFPPYMSRFLLVTFLLMIAVGISASSVVLFVSSLDPRWVLVASISAALVFVFFNILVTRGVSLGVLGLKALSVACLVISLISLLVTSHVVPCVVSASLALVSLITIQGSKYQEMFRYMQDVREFKRAKRESGS